MIFSGVIALGSTILLRYKEERGSEGASNFVKTVSNVSYNKSKVIW